MRINMGTQFHKEKNKMFLQYDKSSFLYAITADLKFPLKFSILIKYFNI